MRPVSLHACQPKARQRRLRRRCRAQMGGGECCGQPVHRPCAAGTSLCLQAAMWPCICLLADRRHGARPAAARRRQGGGARPPAAPRRSAATDLNTTLGLDWAGCAGRAASREGVDPAGRCTAQRPAHLAPSPARPALFPGCCIAAGTCHNGHRGQGVSVASAAAAVGAGAGGDRRPRRAHSTVQRQCAWWQPRRGVMPRCRALPMASRWRAGSRRLHAQGRPS